MKKTTHLLCASLVVAASSAFSTPSLAVDIITLPGSICQPEIGAQQGFFDNTVTNGIQNISTVTRFVTCPLVRDNHNNLNGTDNVLVVVNRDGVAAGNTPVICTLYSKTVSGGTLAANSAQFLGAGATTLALNVNASALNGYYALRCSLPPKARVIDIVVNEPL